MMPINVAVLRRITAAAPAELWPSVAFDSYPDQSDFMQFVPVSPTATESTLAQSPPRGCSHG